MTISNRNQLRIHVAKFDDQAEQQKETIMSASRTETTRNEDED